MQRLAFLTLCAAFLLLGAPVCADFYVGTDVVELTGSNFKARVIDDEHVWMVEFFAPWCGHCQRLKPDFIRAAASAKGIVKFGAVNCDEDNGRGLAAEYDVKGFPTLKLFGTNKKKPQDYNGARTVKGMTEASIALLPTHVTPVTSKSHDKFLSTSLLPKAVLFTTKPATTPLYKALALDLKGRVLFAEVRKQAELLSKYGLTEADQPALVVLPAGAVPEAAVKYTGAMKHNALLDFLSKYAGSKKRDKEQKEWPGGSRTTSTRSSNGKYREGKTSESAQEEHEIAIEHRQPEKVAEVRNAGELNEHCPKHSSRLCVIGLLRDEGLDASVGVLIELSKKYKADPLHFVWLKASEHALVLESFGAPMEVGGPLIAVLNQKKGKAAAMAAGLGLVLDATIAGAVLDRGLGGDLTWKKLPDAWEEAFGEGAATL